MLLVVGVSTNGAAYTPMQSREDALDIAVSIHPSISYGGLNNRIFVNYIPIEQASSRVTITVEIWQSGRLIENYTHRHFFWHKNQWGSCRPPFPSLVVGLYRIVVTFVGDENETIRLYKRNRKLIDIGTEVRTVEKMLHLPLYFPDALFLLFMASVVFTVWYLRRFPYQRVYPLCSDGRYG